MEQKNEWRDREPGPDCYCGRGRGVVLVREGELPELLCIFHTNQEGAVFCLPKERPENWPDLNNDEMQVLIEEGIRQHGEQEEGRPDGQALCGGEAGSASWPASRPVMSCSYSILHGA